MKQVSGCVLVLLAFLALADLQKIPVHAQDRQPVALELVLAIDASTSVDAWEFDLQKQGLHEAFRHPQVIEAIEATGFNGIAVALIQWSGPGKQSRVTDWTVVRDAVSAEAFARDLEAVPRVLQGFTDAGGAIRYSMLEIENNIYSGQRLVIDVSGDGTSPGLGTARARDEAVRRGIVVNGLAIYSNEYDLGALANDALDRFYQNQVIGGSGAFLMVADNFDDFRLAIRKKLIREISGALLAEME